MSGNKVADNGDLMLLLGEATTRPLTPEEADRFRAVLLRDSELMANGVDPDVLLDDIRRKNRGRYQPLRDPGFDVWQFLARFGEPTIESGRERARVLSMIDSGNDATVQIVDFIMRWAGVTEYAAQQRYARFLCPDSKTDRKAAMARIKKRCQREGGGN